MESQGSSSHNLIASESLERHRGHSELKIRAFIFDFGEYDGADLRRRLSDRLDKLHVTLVGCRLITSLFYTHEWLLRQDDDVTLGKITQI